MSLNRVEVEEREVLRAAEQPDDARARSPSDAGSNTPFVLPHVRLPEPLPAAAEFPQRVELCVQV